MKVSEFVVNYLASLNVTDVFGVPGGVILDLLYAFQNNSNISPHLSYHEQCAALEACGYSQSDFRLGVAYATRGPGFTNLITGIAEAYADSLPVLFITAHSGRSVNTERRFEKDQELNTVSIVKNITKYAKVIDYKDDVVKSVKDACKIALSGRKGPVFLDFSSSLWNYELSNFSYDCNELFSIPEDSENLVNLNIIDKLLAKAIRPVILIGDGIRQAHAISEISRFFKNYKIPVLSSRVSEDIGVLSNNFFGYIGSHGIRYANVIFSKSDFVISIGNRLGFPVNSVSFRDSFFNKKVIRIETDEKELSTNLPNTVCIKCDLKKFFKFFDDNIRVNDYTEWLNTCALIKSDLESYDKNNAIEQLSRIFRNIKTTTPICCDVGNNEFWVSRAYIDSGIKNRILFSKSFGTLGCGIPKAIGLFYATKQPVLCIVGDQGFQFNIQELQFISKENLPICIIVVNNQSSGMIRSREKKLYSENYVHTTCQSGYGVPPIKKIAEAYGIEYSDRLCEKKTIIELNVDEDVDLFPSLAVGECMIHMTPKLNLELLRKIEAL